MPELILFDAQRVLARCAKRGLLPPRPRWAAWLMACGIALGGANYASAGQACRPTLTHQQLSPMLAPTLERKWTATVVAEASGCATTAGYFELGISRLKEFGPEVEFREQFIWSSPSVTIGVDFAADEAVEQAWIDTVQACSERRGISASRLSRRPRAERRRVDRLRRALCLLSGDDPPRQAGRSVQIMTRGAAEKISSCRRSPR